jgi:hypothetical protein
MANHSESNHLAANEAPKGGSRSWLKVGVIAAGSAIVGGLAMAWWYRKTLRSLRQTGESGENTDFGISERNPLDEE